MKSFNSNRNISPTRLVSLRHVMILLVFVVSYVSYNNLLTHLFIIQNYHYNHRLEDVTTPLVTETRLVVNDNKDEDKKPLRVLVGIFTTDFDDGFEYRERHRTLFKAWNDSRICSFNDYEQLVHHNIKNSCEFIYTFVIGANPDGPPMLLTVSTDADDVTDTGNDTATGTGSNHSELVSWTVPRPIVNVTNDDINTHNDITLLNIRENMNDGKSQTWIAYYTKHLLKSYHFDFVTKWDADSILLLPEYFEFVDNNLPMSQYTSMMYIGIVRAKPWYKKRRPKKETIRKEAFFQQNYYNLHVYVTGEVYMIANDLAQCITNEAIVQFYQSDYCSYCEGNTEDHDITALAFFGCSTPIKFVFIGLHQRFWIHPIKTTGEWNNTWHQEMIRIDAIKKNNTVALL